MDIKSKLISLRAEHNLTQKELGKIAGVSGAAISAWELGDRSPKIKPLQNICLYFGIDINSFVDESSDTYKMALPSNILPLHKMKKVPLVGQIACGTPILAEQNIEDYIDLPGHIRADFALTCRGDSMELAGIKDGDVVYIRSQKEVENGQIAAVMVGDDEATLKRFYYDGGMIQLVAENRRYPPKVFVGDEINRVHVIGLAVAYTHTIEQ